MGDVLPRGTKVDDYRIERPLGWGGAAVVYEAIGPYLERPVALKVMLPHIGSDPVFQKRFRREGGIHSSLAHPNIVTVFDAGESDEHGFWIAMMLMRGGSLEGRFKKPVALDPDRTIELLAPIAAALDFAHAKGQIHRDVKPENILLDEEDVPSLTDFGIAKSVDGSRLTLTGQGIGTPGYMAPEQIQGKDITHRVDVYSLAVVLFKCLTGEVPLPGADGMSRGRLRISRGIPDASDCNPELPKAIDEVIRKGMQARPGRRHAKASMLIDDARRALAEGAVRQSAVFGARLPRDPKRVVLTGVSSAVVLGLLGLGLGGATKSTSQLRPTRLATGGLELSMPSDWVESRGRPVVSGLGVSEPVSLRSPLEPAGEQLAISAGLSGASGASLLPPAYRAQLNDDTRRVPVALGSLRAYRYGLETPRAKLPVTIFVAPTTRGVAILACRMPGRGDERAPARLCSRVASTLVLRTGASYPLGPSVAFEKALRLRFAKLTRRRAADRESLARADGAEAQASAAGDIADAFRTAAKGLASPRLSPEISPARTRLVAALRLTRDAYEDLAVAARREDQARYVAAAAAVDAAEEAVGSGLGDLRALGYRTVGSAPKRSRSSGA
jgi:serine/threonine protein kinase